MIKKILHTLITKILSSGMGFLIIILVSQFLGAEGKGEQSIFVFNYIALMLIATLIGNSVLIYLTPRHKFSELFFPAITWIICSIVTVFIIISFIPSLNITYPFELLLIGILAAITEVNTFVLIGKEDVKKANNLKISWQIFSLAYLLILISTNQFTSVHDFVFSLLFGYFLSFIYGVYLLKEEYSSLKMPSKSKFWEMLKLLFRLGAIKQLGSIAQLMNSRLTFYLISFYCGNKVLGIFSNGVSISEAVMMLGISLSLVQYSKLSNTKDDEYAKRLSINMTKVNILFTSLALIFFSVLPSSFYVFIFGQEFGEINNIIRVLAIGILMLSISNTFTQHFASKGNFTITAYATLLGLASTLGFGLWLIPEYGMYGAAITMVISYSLSASIELYYFHKWTKSRFSDFLIKKGDFLELKNYFKKD